MDSSPVVARGIRGWSVSWSGSSSVVVAMGDVSGPEAHGIVGPSRRRIHSTRQGESDGDNGGLVVVVLVLVLLILLLLFTARFDFKGQWMKMEAQDEVCIGVCERMTESV